MRYLPETQDQQASILTVEVPMFQLEREEVPDNWSPVHLKRRPSRMDYRAVYVRCGGAWVWKVTFGTKTIGNISISVINCPSAGLSLY